MKKTIVADRGRGRQEGEGTLHLAGIDRHGHLQGGIDQERRQGIEIGARERRAERGDTQEGDQGVQEDMIEIIITTSIAEIENIEDEKKIKWQ